MLYTNIPILVTDLSSLIRGKLAVVFLVAYCKRRSLLKSFVGTNICIKQKLKVIYKLLISSVCMFWYICMFKDVTNGMNNNSPLKVVTSHEKRVPVIGHLKPDNF
jgi:hypothetical protein